MAIPEGYRLLTVDDVGKVFGVDLESMVYFDEDITPTFYLTSIGSLNLTNFCKEERDYLPYAEYEVSSGIYLYGNTNDYIYYSLAGRFYPTEADLSGVEITSFNTNYSWNNWLYVKDIEVNDPYTITISNKSGITLLVEGKYLTKDITILLDKSLFGESGEEEGGGESGGTNTWSVEDVSGASYGFALNSAGYYESKNKGKKSTSAVCKVVLDIKSSCKMYVDCINYAESSYDYGLLSKLDKIFTVSATADSTDVFKSFKNLQSSSIVTVDYGTITVGSHFIYVKFVKDSSQDKNYDTLQFKVRLE